MMKTKIVLILIMITLNSSLAFASSKSIHIPKSDRQSLSVTNQSLSVERLFNSYRSMNVSERRLAEMYFIGVVDASEGKEWCGFQIVKATSIREIIYSALESAMKTQPTARASQAIISRLQNSLPCKEEK
ncbi:MAG: hypothetical protein GY787_09140 [Alteromonadales bacterium]|nr:hypothetical protein [Alteromonadales bacterium]